MAQTEEKGPWWPHPIWGEGDGAGGSNWITPEKIIEALSMVESGVVHELGHVYEKGMPLVGERSYNMVIPSFPTSGPLEGLRLVFNDEFLATEIGQVGTQFDGPGHVGKEVDFEDGTTHSVFYNGTLGEEMRGPYGLQKNGVENVKPYITRGIFLDVAGYKGEQMLAGGYEITVADIRGTLARQEMTEEDVKPGDALLFNLGWWRIWPDQQIVDAASPYLGKEAVAWIIDKKVAIVGSDRALDDDEFFVHEELVLKNGVFNLEFMNFSTLVEAGDYAFLFIFTPLRLKGATGSPGRPIAIL